MYPFKHERCELVPFLWSPASSPIIARLLLKAIDSAEACIAPWFELLQCCYNPHVRVGKKKTLPIRFDGVGIQSYHLVEEFTELDISKKFFSGQIKFTYVRYTLCDGPLLCLMPSCSFLMDVLSVGDFSCR